jgi:phage terminase large subunit-like protein
VGTTICQMLDLEQVRLTSISPEGKDKLTRVHPLILKFEQGEILLPKHELSWRHRFESELLGWTGHKREPCDQIDAAAYAAIVGERNRPRQDVVVIEPG